MALHALPHLRLPLTSHSPWKQRNDPSTTFTMRPQPLTLMLPPIRISPRRMPAASVVEESQESSEPDSTEEEKQQQQQSELASELKKAMQERKDKEADSDNFWGGVAQEIKEIEWPSFSKVLGTTGVVISVILGSSVVLLTVNAVLAELSDRVFAGKGVQDFFS